MPVDLASAVGRMPPFMSAFWILKKAKAMPKITVQIDERTDRLGAELTEPRLAVVEDAGDALADAAAPFVGAVPAGAVVAVGEDADAEHAEDAADAVDRDRADRVVDALLRSMKNTASIDEIAGDDADDRRRPRLRRTRTAP